MADVKNAYFDAEAAAVTVTLSYSVESSAPVYAQGFVGISNRSGDSGDNVALSIGKAVYQFDVGASLAVSIGDVVRVDTTSVTGHMIPQAALNKNAASATNLDLFKAVENKDANNIVRGILMGG